MPYIRSGAMAKADPAGIAMRRNTREFGRGHTMACCFPGLVQRMDREVPSSEYPAWIVSSPMWFARIPSPAVKYSNTQQHVVSPSKNVIPGGAARTMWVPVLRVLIRKLEESASA